MTAPASQEVTVYQEPVSAGALIQSIDIAGERAHLEKFREFIHGVLDKDKGHFGKMPGVKRDFLQQPGAEIIYRAMQARPEYSIESEQIVWEEKLCYYRVKCRVVHVATGSVIGEAEGACSSLEFAANCTVQGTTPQAMVDCPFHGSAPPRMDWDPSTRGRKIPFCSGKNPQGLERTIQNTLAKANKRAMVAAIRTLGCVSEMFSQDEDLVTRPDGGGEEEPPARTRPQPTRPAASRPANGRPAPVQQGQPAAQPAPQQPNPARAVPAGANFSIADIKEAMATIRASGVTDDEIRAYFSDEGTLADGATLGSKMIVTLCDREKILPAEVARRVIFRFAEATPDANEPPTDDVVDGEVVPEEEDDIPL